MLMAFFFFYTACQLPFVSFSMNEIFILLFVCLFVLLNAGKSKKGMTTFLCGVFVSSKYLKVVVK